MQEILGLNISKIISWLSVLGFFLVAIGLHLQFYISNVLKRGTKTEGKVIEIRRNPGNLFSSEEGEGFAPVVEYTTTSDQTRIHYSTTYRTPTPYQENQLVPIWYIDYKSRKEAALADDEPGTFPRKLIVVGAALLLLASPSILSNFLGLI